MTAFMNAVRFFGSFNFLTPPTTGQLSRYTLSLSALRSRPFHGTSCAYRSAMLDKTERMNTRDQGLPVIPPADFKAEVLESGQPVLVAFWAPWSRPCQVLDSVLQQVSSACAENIKIVKVNADDSLDLSLWYDIQSVPTLIYFVRGNPCVRVVGTASKEAILAKLKPFSQ
jgi:thioredoxin 1